MTKSNHPSGHTPFSLGALVAGNGGTVTETEKREAVAVPQTVNDLYKKYH